MKFNDTEEVNSVILWEGAKAVLRGEIIRYSSAKKRQREQIKTELELEIKTLEDKHKNSCDLNLNRQLKKKYAELDRLLTEEVEKSLILTKQKNDDGDQN